MTAQRINCGNGLTLARRTVKHYGWKPDLPDARDSTFSYQQAARARGMLLATRLPAEVDLRTSDSMPPVYDQGNLGSCTANAIAGAFEFEQRRQKLDDFMPSRLFIYYNERLIEGTVDQDSGAQIRDGMKAVATLGVPPETEWPYDISKFTEKPSDQAFVDALQHQCMTYSRLSMEYTRASSRLQVGRIEHNINVLKQVLAIGVPVALGFTVFESFEDTGSTGIVNPNEGQVLGGHAVCAVGYRQINTKDYIIVRNSWGTSWGESGYCYFPATWLCNLDNADDFWAIQSVEAPTPSGQ